jgi:CheY-like chemotaxis protein
MSTIETNSVDDTKVLLVVAEAPVGATLVDLCREAPVRIDLAPTGGEALALAGRSRPDLILIDADLSGIDPLTCCSAFKADGDLTSVPVIILVSPERERELFYQAGCDGFLVKPLEKVAVYELLSQYIMWPERRNTRVPFYTPVTIEVKDEYYSGLIGDMSTGGLFVATLDRLPEDGDLRLSFRLENKESLLVEVQGRIAWVNSKVCSLSESLPEGFGVEIISVGDKELVAIREIIAANRK